jgi:hypothetical protein
LELILPDFNVTVFLNRVKWLILPTLKIRRSAPRFQGSLSWHEAIIEVCLRHITRRFGRSAAHILVREALMNSWIPVFAGMTDKSNTDARHSGQGVAASRNPGIGASSKISIHIISEID